MLSPACSDCGLQVIETEPKEPASSERELEPRRNSDSRPASPEKELKRSQEKRPSESAAQASGKKHLENSGSLLKN
jgi:predicted  nucleic acid-binding Zn-ribbon protein